MWPFSRRDDDRDQQAAAAVLTEVFAEIEPRLVAGISTQDIDDLVRAALASRRARSYFAGYHGYPAHCTTAINEEVLDTVPSSRRLEAGDLLKLQIGTQVGARYGTQGWTYAIGGADDDDARLIAAGLRALRAGVSEANATRRVGDISSAIDDELAAASMVPSLIFVGHGMTAAAPCCSAGWCASVTPAPSRSCPSAATSSRDGRG
jgi:methionyl aminopeptidase